MNATRKFTGWHMLAIMIAFFAVIVAVNLTMAMFASTSWTGLVVKNSYVASQGYNETLAAAERQRSAGWTSELSYGDGLVKLVIRGQSGAPLDASEVELFVGRPATERDDRTLKLARTGPGAYQSELALGPGLWSARVTGFVGDTPYRRDLRLMVSDDGRGKVL